MPSNLWLPSLLVLALAAYWLADQELINEGLGPPAAFYSLPSRLSKKAHKVFEAVRPAVVRVESLNTITHQAKTGTGFFITRAGELLTAYHVVEANKLIKISTLEGKRFNANLVAYDEQEDIALLQIEGKGTFPTLNLASSLPQIREEIFAIGNSHYDFLQARPGRLLRLNVKVSRTDFPQQTLEMNADLAPGDSGGPIINTRGQAIGLVSYIQIDDNEVTHASYGVPLTQSSNLLAALRAVEKKNIPSRD